MKFFIMLTVILSAFLMFSCGGSDSGTSGGISESEFYTASAVQTCEKGFKCDIDYLKGGKTDISECKSETTQSNCTYDFNGVKAKECNDCMENISCEDYKNDAGVKACPVCSEVCTYKP